jgi:hypothetical protein
MLCQAIKWEKKFTIYQRCIGAMGYFRGPLLKGTKNRNMSDVTLNTGMSGVTCDGRNPLYFLGFPIGVFVYGKAPGFGEREVVKRQVRTRKEAPWERALLLRFH